MKIRKVKWVNHPVLGNLELDFVNPLTNHPFSTIVFVGENGSGKTTTLETLNTFLCIGSFKPFDMIEFEVQRLIGGFCQKIVRSGFLFRPERLTFAENSRELWRYWGTDARLS